MNPVDMGIGWAQRAVYEALTSDGGITIDSTAVPVRADVMPNQQPPYILLTNRAEDRWNVHSGLGSDVIIAVEVITRGNGHYERAQLHEIMNQVRARLDHQRIQITAQTYPPIPAPITATFTSLSVGVDATPTKIALKGTRGTNAQRTIAFWVNLSERSISRPLIRFQASDGWQEDFEIYYENATKIRLSHPNIGYLHATVPEYTTGWHSYVLTIFPLHNEVKLYIDDEEPITTWTDPTGFYTHQPCGPVVFPANGHEWAQVMYCPYIWTAADVAAYLEVLPENPRDLATWLPPEVQSLPMWYYPFLTGDDAYNDAINEGEALTVIDEALTVTLTTQHYFPTYEPEPTPVPPEVVPTINGCLFESAVIIDEPDGETLRGESRYRVYLRAPSGD